MFSYHENKHTILYNDTYIYVCIGVVNQVMIESYA